MWQFLQTINGIPLDISANGVNTLNNALKSLTISDVSHRTAAGLFVCTFTDATTITVTGSTFEDLGNPSIPADPITVITDGTTENDNVLPGLSMVFYPNVLTGSTFLVSVGGAFSDYDCYRALSFGPVITGFFTSARPLSVYQDFEVSLDDCLVVATNALWVENGQAYNRPLKSFGQVGYFNPGLSGNVPITFADLTAGSPNTVSILVDGSQIDVWNVTDEEAVPLGIGLKCDGTTQYRFLEGSTYQSGAFVLSTALAETDTATLYGSEGGSSVSITLLSSGVFQPGTTPLGIGDLDPTDSEDLLIQADVKDSVTGSSDQLVFSFRAVGYDSNRLEYCNEILGTIIPVEAVQGSFLNVAIQAVEPYYSLGLQKYERIETPAEDPEDPPIVTFEPASDGAYVKDLNALEVYVLIADHPTQGNYKSLVEILAENGVTFG